MGQSKLSVVVEPDGSSTLTQDRLLSLDRPFSPIKTVHFGPDSKLNVSLKKLFSFSGHIDEGGKRYIKCLNTPGTCRHALCLCDAALAEGLRDYGDDWSQDLHRDWGSFNFNQKW